MVARGLNSWAMWMGGVAFGAGALYLTDPVQGKRRRAQAQHKLQAFMQDPQGEAGEVLRELSHQWDGLKVQTGRLLQRDRVKPIDDHVLAARVRSRMGRKISYPHAIEVLAEKGRVVLTGSVLAAEHAGLLDFVQGIPGVESVKDKLQLHQDDDDMYSSYGEGEGHSVSSRAVVTAAGAALGAYLVRRPVLGLLLTLAGTALVVARSGRQVAESAPHAIRPAADAGPHSAERAELAPGSTLH
jgi:hypothetical protein